MGPVEAGREEWDRNPTVWRRDARQAPRVRRQRAAPAQPPGNPSVTPASTGPPSLQCALKAGSACKQAGRCQQASTNAAQARSAAGSDRRAGCGGQHPPAPLVLRPNRPASCSSCGRARGWRMWGVGGPKDGPAAGCKPAGRGSPTAKVGPAPVAHQQQAVVPCKGRLVVGQRLALRPGPRQGRAGALH